MLGIGRTHFENVRNHLATNGIIPRIHGNVKKLPRWKTKITQYIKINGTKNANCTKNAKVQKTRIYPSKHTSITNLLTDLGYIT